MPATKLGQGYVFTHVCDCVQGGWYPSMHYRWYPSMPCSSSPGGVWYPSMPCRFPGPHPEGKFRGLARGVSRPTPGGSRSTPKGGLQAHTQGVSPGPHLGGVSQHALRQTPPPSRRLLLRAVRILLECILVSIFLFSCDYIVIPVLGAYFVTY